MTWLSLALLAAVAATVSDALRKRLVRELDPYVVSALISGVATVALLPVALATAAGLDAARFVLALVVSGGINAAAAVMVARSVQLSDLSLVAPLQGTTPIFALGLGTVVLGEFPSAAGVLGVVTITVGTWMLAAGGRSGGLVAPLRALWRDRGARLMLLVAFLWGTSVTFDKMGVLASAPLVWAFALQAVVAVLTGLRVLASDPRRAQVRDLGARDWALAVLTGLILALMLFAQFWAYLTGLAAYVIAVKRTSILLSVLAGGVFFRERDLGARLVGSAVILAGLALLTLD